MSRSINTGIQVEQLMDMLRVKSETAARTACMFPKPVDQQCVESVYAGICLYWLYQTQRKPLAEAFDAACRELAEADPEGPAHLQLMEQVRRECAGIQSGCSHADRSTLDLINIGLVFALADVSLKYFQAPATEESRGRAASLVTFLLEGINGIG